MKAFDELQRITEAIYIDADDAVKGTSICTIPVASGSSTGHFRSSYVQPFLKFIDSDEIYEPGEDFLFNVGAELEKYRKRPEWRRAAYIYYRNVVENLSYDQIAAKENIAVSTISEHVTRMSGEMDRLAGEKYEVYKVKQLQQRGYKATRYGGISEPDIVAQHENGGLWVYSCKCLNYKMKRWLPVDQINPELKMVIELRKKGTPAGLILSVFNLHDRTEQEMPIDVEHCPKTLEISLAGGQIHG